jgi:3-phenylpropionate/trans-cinnamate dioxygenase ferredoxin reductase subunit
MAEEDGAKMAGGAATVVIVGAGHAGAAAAGFLRQFGHAGPVTLLGAEPVAPYQRPPLSKAYLKGECGLESLFLKPASFYEKQNIVLRTGMRVTTIDRRARRVLLEGGESLPYDALILATGSQNLRLPCLPADARGAHELRSLADADRLKPELAPGRRLVIVGGGYIGLEAAATARMLGAEATVIEREPRVLARTGSAALAAFFEGQHRAQGVLILTGASVERVETGAGGRISALVLAGGGRIACDALLTGIGAHAADALAREAGLECDGGVVADIEARTSDPAIFAIGDVSKRPLPLYEGRMFRLESVPNALEQAKQAAAAIAGAPAPKPEVPWFWSDQYGLKLQIAGLPFEADEAVTRGDPATARFSIFHLKQGRVRAVEAVNSGADFMAGKALILSGAAVDRARIADPAAPLKRATA